mgnify:CR=1 FL=1
MSDLADNESNKQYAPFYDAEIELEVLDSSINGVVWLYENSKPSNSTASRVMDMIEKLEKAIGVK